jgi:chemotaxis protein MotB
VRYNAGITQLTGDRMNRLAVALSLVALTACTTGDMLRKKEAEAAQYQADLNTEQARSADLQGKLEAAQTDLKKSQADFQKSQADAKALRAELEASEARLGEVQSSKQQLEVAKADLERKSAEYEQLAGSLKGEIEAGRVELTELRGKMTVKMKDKILFSSGSAALGKDGRNALQAVADALRSVQGKTIRVEGHTDNVPTTGSAFPTNWHLSTARSLAVVRFLESAGVDPTKLAAAGYGQFQPVSTNDTPEGRSLNRRIEIVLAPADAAQ